MVRRSWTRRRGRMLHQNVHSSPESQHSRVSARATVRVCLPPDTGTCSADRQVERRKRERKAPLLLPLSPSPTQVASLLSRLDVLSPAVALCNQRDSLCTRGMYTCAHADMHSLSLSLSDPLLSLLPNLPPPPLRRRFVRKKGSLSLCFALSSLSLLLSLSLSLSDFDLSLGTPVLL